LSIDLTYFVEKGFEEEALRAEIATIMEESNVPEVDAFNIWKAKSVNEIRMRSMGEPLHALYLYVQTRKSEEYGDSYRFNLITYKLSEEGKIEDATYGFLNVSTEEFAAFIKKYPEEPELMETWLFDAAYTRERDSGVFISCIRDMHDGQRVPNIERKGKILSNTEIKEIFKQSARFPMEWQDIKIDKSVFDWAPVTYAQVTNIRFIDSRDCNAYTLTDLSTPASYLPYSLIDWDKKFPDIQEHEHLFIVGGFAKIDPERSVNEIILSNSKNSKMQVIRVPFALENT